MILVFDKEVDELARVVSEFDEANPGKTRTEIGMILAGVLDRGMSMERERCIHIIQRLSVNAMDVVREIRKPLR